ncbi:MAG: preprotein translocase subunit SecE [Clostridia bacterium]
MSADKMDKKIEKKAEKKPEKKKVSIITRISNYFRESKSEFKKIVWPSKKQIINNSLIVFAGIIIAGLAISAMDYIFTTGIGFVIQQFAK